MIKNDSISIVIPAFNEEKRLPLFLQELADFARKFPQLQEVIVVDDGSTDQTVSAAQKFAKDFKEFQIVSSKKNRGKGFSVRRGMLEAQGDILIFMDADGATGASEILPGCEHLSDAVQVVVGSRVLHDQAHAIKAKWYRKIIGRIFNGFACALVNTGIKDTQCGFKIFTRKAARDAFKRVRVERFGFDIEVIFLAQRLGYGVKEIPVNWVHKEGSKVNLVVDSIQMLWNMVQIRFWHGRVKPR